MATSPKLEIAICGAGIAGLTSAIALLKHPNIDVQIYEQATELREIGASIALGPNGLRTLERLGLHNAISDEVGYRGPSKIPMIYKHWKTNEVLGEDHHSNVTEHLHHTARYYRAHLQEALLEHVPRDIIHLGKRFSSAEVSDDGVALTFEDGEKATAEILIGADGLRSGVRQFLAPELELKWSGWTAFRAIFEYDLVKDIPDLPLDSNHWWGPNTTFFASILGKNKYTVVGGVNSDPAKANTPLGNVQWDQEANVKLLRDTYADWNPVVKALANATPDIRYYSNFAVAGALDTWVFNDRITLIGDAAHAHGGAYATGGSLAIDDAYALYLAVNQVFPESAVEKPAKEKIGEALRLYEATRKPHAERLLEVVHKANKAKAARAEKSLTDTEMRKMAAARPDTVWLHEHDVVGAFNEVLKRERASSGTKLGECLFSARL